MQVSQCCLACGLNDSLRSHVLMALPIRKVTRGPISNTAVNPAYSRLAALMLSLQAQAGI